jgi:quinol monooxygenase YgiN
MIGMEDGSTGARSELDAEVAADLETEIDVTIVTLRFDASDDAGLLAVLSKYIVLARMEDGCRNIDLVSSVTKPGRHLVIEKWESPDHQRRHFDSELMVEMATACTGILAAPPEIDLREATSAHDLA